MLDLFRISATFRYLRSSRVPLVVACRRFFCPSHFVIGKWLKPRFFYGLLWPSVRYLFQPPKSASDFYSSMRYNTEMGTLCCIAAGLLVWEVYLLHNFALSCQYAIFAIGLFPNCDAKVLHFLRSIQIIL